MFAITLLITLEPFETLYSSRGMTFTVLLFRETERKEERKRYNSVAPLATIHPVSFLRFLLSPLFSAPYKGMLNA